MRIVHVVPYYPPPHSGGMEQVAFELATRSAALGHDVLVLTAANRGIAPGVTRMNSRLTVERLP